MARGRKAANPDVAAAREARRNLLANHLSKIIPKDESDALSFLVWKNKVTAGDLGAALKRVLRG